MIIEPIKTRVLAPPKDNLLSVINESIKEIPDKSILVISSKVVSIWQGRCLDSKKFSKRELAMSEADKFLEEEKRILSIKNGLMISNCGIDKSNSSEFFTLWPEDPFNSAKEIHRWLVGKYKVKNLGVLIVDSKSIPLRRGVVGVSLGFYGINPLNDHRGKTDLFGRNIRFSQSNVVDSIASSAVLVMGETNESTPLAIVKDIPFVQFEEKLNLYNNKKPYSSFFVGEQEDMFYSLIEKLPWKKNNNI